MPCYYALIAKGRSTRSMSQGPHSLGMLPVYTLEACAETHLLRNLAARPTMRTSNPPPATIEHSASALLQIVTQSGRGAREHRE